MGYIAIDVVGTVARKNIIDRGFGKIEYGRVEIILRTRTVAALCLTW